MALDGDMSMDAKLISNFITEQVAVAMAEKSRKYEKKSKKLEKGGKDNEKGESTSKNGTRGGGRASRKNKQSKTHQNPKSVPPPKFASQSAPRRQIILRSPSRGKSQQAGASDSGTPEKRKKKKAVRSKSASRLTLRTTKTDGAKSRGQSKIR